MYDALKVFRNNTLINYAQVWNSFHRVVICELNVAGHAG